MTKHQKRLSAPKHYPISRKENTYVSTIKGSRSFENAVPTVILLRDVLEFAENEKEAKKIIRKGDVLRNGDRVKDIKEGVGLLDVVELPKLEQSFRAVRKGDRLEFVPVEDGDRVAAKVVDKDQNGEDFVYRLHNGENYNTGDEFETGSTLVFNGGVKELTLDGGKKVLVVAGKHAGKTAELEEINQRGMNPDTGTISTEEKTFEIQLENLVAIGDIEVE